MPNVRRRTGEMSQGNVGGAKNAVSPQVKNESDEAKPIKNSVAMQPGKPGGIVPRNSVTSVKG